MKFFSSYSKKLPYYPSFLYKHALDLCKSQQTSGSEAPKEGAKTVEVSELAAGNYCGVNEELHKLISSKENL
ncbi:MAG: hypothetical protein R3B93_04125 [Bacteroidia bacterium]